MPQADRHRRCAAHDSSSRDVFGDTRFSCQLSAVADPQVSSDCNLPTCNHKVTEFCAAGNTGLCSDNATTSEPNVVGYLH